MIKLEKLVIITSLLIAGCAAYFSVYGIGLLFSGAIISSMIMATSLELGKLVSTSWLFRNWYKINNLMKIYMVLAVLVLMGITSLGIFGFLTAAFQKSSLETELSVTKISTLESQKSQEKIQLENTKQNIDKLFKLRSGQENRLTEILTNTLVARNPIQLQNIQTQIGEQIESINKQMEDENVRIKTYEDKITTIDQQIFDLKISNSQKKDITTFKFVADEFDTSIQTIVKWFIVILITVFDPLAVVLLLAYNVSKKEEIEKEKPTVNDFSETKNTTKEVIKEIPVEKQIIKEVPVEKEVVKEVVKEVPVEKEVVKEVIKEINTEQKPMTGYFSF